MSAEIAATMPHSIEAEENLLSCCLLDGGETVSRCLEAGIRAESFYLAAHGIIFERLERLFRRQQPIAVSILAEELKAAGQLESIGGYAFLTQVSSRIPTTAETGYFIQTVVQKHQLREIVKTSHRAIEDAQSATDAADAIARARTAFQAAADGATLANGRFPLLEHEPLEKEILETAESIVKDLLEAGDKMILSSGSKSFKTWTLVQLAYCIATGTRWLGFETKPARVLFLNFEIKPGNFWRRVWRVRKALGLSESKNFIAWNLRGQGFSMDSHADELIHRAKKCGAKVIVLDPIYKLFGDRNESSAGDMATLMTIFDRVATQTGAAIIFAHHFAKGSAAAKDSIDRASGSGVFARDPDCIVTLTRLDEAEGANTFSASVTLREFAPIDDFAVRREHPIMVRADGVNVANLHEPNKRKAKYSIPDLVALLPRDGATVAEWQRLAHDNLGMGRGTFYDYIPAAKRAAQSKGNRWLPILTAA